MQTQLPPYRKMQIGRSVIFGTLLVAAAASYWALPRAADSQRWVRHTNDVNAHVADLGWAIEDMQVAARGFNLSANDGFMQSAFAARKRADQERVVLLALTTDNPDQQGRLASLASLGQPVTAKDFARAFAPDALEAYRAVSRAVERAERELLSERQARVEQHFHQAELALSVGSVLGLIFIAAAAVVARRDNATIKQTRADSDERIRVLVDGVQDYAIFMLDPNGTVVSWNAGAERIKGYQAAEIIGRHYSCFYPPEDIDLGRPQEELRTAAENGRTEVERWRVRKDGTRFMANLLITAARDSSGKLSGFSEISRDITVRKAAEAQLATLAQELDLKHRLLNSVVEGIADPIYIRDLEDRFVLVNNACAKLFNISVQNMVGMSMREVLPNDLYLVVAANDREVVRAGGTRIVEERAEIDGTARIFLTTKSPYRDADHKTIGTIGIARDITELRRSDDERLAELKNDIAERRKFQENLLQTVGELKRSNDELEQFAYIASHDLQEPLRMVASYTQLLAKRYKGRLDSDADDFIAYAVDGSSRMQQLINDLLAYSRAGANRKKPHKISSELALLSALSNLQTTIEESGATVTFDALPDVTMDDTQLTQVFQNLIGNAVKYRGKDAPLVHVSVTTQIGTESIFSVQDNGLGIEPQYFEKIFVLFQRLHGRAEFEGTGIGLAICKKMLERRGGRIWVESQVNEGSTFRFAVPQGTET